jgi:hypothetical protein
MKIEKEKQNIYFYREDGRRYRLDLNNGVMHSLKDEPMVSRPKILTASVMYDITRDNNHSLLIRAVVETIRQSGKEAIKVVAEMTPIITQYYDEKNITPSSIYALYENIRDNRYMEYSAKSLSNILKKAKEDGYTVNENGVWVDPDNRNLWSNGLYTIYRNYYEKLCLVRELELWGISPNENFSIEMATDLRAILRNNRTFAKLTDDRKRIYGQWFKAMYCKGYWDIRTATGTTSVVNMSYCIEYVVKWCEAMGINPEKTNNPFRYIGELGKSYELYREEKSAELFAKRYAIIKGLDELKTDKLCVVFPKSANEVVIEGQRQHNCVGGYVDSIENGNSLVIFVRKIDAEDTNYITCDISRYSSSDKSAWYVNQYLRANNTSVREDFEKEMFDLIKTWVSKNLR